MNSIATIADGYHFLESPHWHEGRLWLTDMYGGQVLSMAEDGSDKRVEVELDDNVGGIGWLPDGRLLVVGMTALKVYRREVDGHLVVHADLGADAQGRLNDMIVAETGVAYVGEFGFDMQTEPVAAGRLHVVGPDGSVTQADGDLLMGNGMRLVGGEVVVAESLGNRLSAYPVDGPVVGPRHDWVVLGRRPKSTDLSEVFGELAVAPDGVCADAEGAVWAADALAGRVVRITPGQGIVDEIQVGTGVFACELGGADGKTLFLCVAPSFLEPERRAARESSLRAVQVHVGRAVDTQ